MLGHTRWASVGIISEANAHPLNQEEEDAIDGPYVGGAQRRRRQLRRPHGARGIALRPEITTDAKVIPALVSRRLAAGDDLAEAFRATVAGLEGSVAIGANATAGPEQLLLALRGSGGALYVGLAEDTFIVASEPYGLVEETSTYLRLDGETPLDPLPPATRGQIVIVHADRAGELDGIERIGYDGTPLPVTEGELHHAQITTRDIDRGDYPHFLLKEISEAPASFRKTLRGKIVEHDGRLSVVLPDETLSDDIRPLCATAPSAASP